MRQGRIARMSGSTATCSTSHKLKRELTSGSASCAARETGWRDQPEIRLRSFWSTLTYPPHVQFGGFWKCWDAINPMLAKAVRYPTRLTIDSS
jgi:hypothetical protein